MSKTSLLLTLMLTVVIVGSGCRSDMQDQPRYKPYKESAFFADKRASRDFEAGTVARGYLKADKPLYTGLVDGTTNGPAPSDSTITPNSVTEFPIPVTKAVLDRGEERYKVFCGVCHGPLGAGDGMIVRRGFVTPGQAPLPNFNDDRLRNAPVGHFFYVISNGVGRMSSYASSIPVKDRWAIVAYIRALQLGQNPDLKTASSAPMQSGEAVAGGAN